MGRTWRKNVNDAGVGARMHEDAAIIKMSIFCRNRLLDSVLESNGKKITLEQRKMNYLLRLSQNLSFYYSFYFGRRTSSL